MNIKVKKYEHELFEHFGPDNKSLGFLNYYESLDLRVQIKKNKVQGCWIKSPYYDQPGAYAHCNIDEDGRIDYWPPGLYDKIDMLLIELL